MKAGLLKVAMLTMTILVGASSLSFAASGFVSNGDFEGGFSNGVGNGWSTWKSSWSNTVTYAQDNSSQLAGTYCQRWGRGDHYRVHGGLKKQIGVTAGQSYEIIAWVRMDAADTGAWLEMGYDLTGQTSNPEASSVVYTKMEGLGNRKWVRFSKVVKATSGNISIFTKFGQYNQSGGPNWAYVDNVSVQPRTVLEAEDFTNYYDSTSGNAGGAYRSTNVDIGWMPDGSGYFVGWTANGEWLEWSNVYSFGVDHVAVIEYSAYSDSVVTLKVDGVQVGGNITLPKTGWWDSYRRVVVPTVAWMGGGNHTVRLTFVSASCNIDKVILVPITAGPFLQAEDYSSAYDTTAGNSGGQYRWDYDVDIENGVEGYDVGWTAAGEWLQYPVSGDGRNYVAVLRYSGMYNASINLQVNGSNVTGSVSLPATGGWQTWKSVVTPVFNIPTGASDIKFYEETGGFNINYIAMIPLGDGNAGSDQLAGVHFAGGMNNGILDMAGWRGAGQWIYSVECFATYGRDPDTDQNFINDMTYWVTSYLRPMYQNRIRPIVRIDYNWGENVPRLLSGNQVDYAAVDRYKRTFRKFAQICDANGVPVRHLIVGNEMNLKCEANGFANGYIPEWYYAYVYHECRNEVTNGLNKGNTYEVMVGAVSPAMVSGDPLQGNGTIDWNLYSQDGLVYMENVVTELKRKGTQNVCFALHAYADFDTRQNYSINW